MKEGGVGDQQKGQMGSDFAEFLSVFRFDDMS